MSQSAIVHDFNRKVGQFPVDIEPSYEGTRDKPISFAGMPASLPPVMVTPKDVTVVLRSIRAPKFKVEYHIPSKNTVFSVKERLLSDPNGPLAGTDHSIASIRLLLKSRAVNDVRLLSDLNSLDFTVMLSSATVADTFVPEQVYWGTSTVNDSTKSAPAVESPEQVASESHKPSAANPSSTPEMLAELTEVLKRYGRSDLIDKLHNIV